MTHGHHEIEWGGGGAGVMERRKRTKVTVVVRRTVKHRAAIRSSDAQEEGMLEGTRLAALDAHEVGQAVGEGADVLQPLT